MYQVNNCRKILPTKNKLTLSSLTWLVLLIETSQRLIQSMSEWNMRKVLIMAKQLACAMSIKSTQSNGIIAIQCALHMKVSKLHYSARKDKFRSMTIQGVDRTTSKSILWKLPTACKIATLNSTWCSAMIVASKIPRIFSEHHTTAIFSNSSSSS